MTHLQIAIDLAIYFVSNTIWLKNYENSSGTRGITIQIPHTNLGERKKPRERLLLGNK